MLQICDASLGSEPSLFFSSYFSSLGFIGLFKVSFSTVKVLLVFFIMVFLGQSPA